MMFLTPEMEKAFKNTLPYPDMLFYTSRELKPISDERDEINELLNRSLTDEQYVLTQRLVKNFIAENRFEFAYYFAQGWRAALRCTEKK